MRRPWRVRAGAAEGCRSCQRPTRQPASSFHAELPDRGERARGVAPIENRQRGGIPGSWKKGTLFTPDHRYPSPSPSHTGSSWRLIQGRARATSCLLVTGTESGQAECLSQTCPEGRAGTGRGNPPTSREPRPRSLVDDDAASGQGRRRSRRVGVSEVVVVDHVSRRLVEDLQAKPVHAPAPAGLTVAG